MFIYTKEGGYGNVDTKALRSLSAIDMGDLYYKLKELIYDYECMLRVINGNDHVYRHPDGSETRRIRLY